MLQPDASNYPHTLAQWLYIAIAAFLASGGTWLGLWSKRKHGPAEVRKINAEARSIEIRDELAISDTVVRLSKEVAEARVEADHRREERLLREDQMRN